MKKEGASIAKQLGVKSLFVNDKGEFFTEENRALISVDKQEERYTKLEFTSAAAPAKEAAPANGAEKVTPPAKKKATNEAAEKVAAPAEVAALGEEAEKAGK